MNKVNFGTSSKIPPINIYIPNFSEYYGTYIFFVVSDKRLIFSDKLKIIRLVVSIFV